MTFRYLQLTLVCAGFALAQTGLAAWAASPPEKLRPALGVSAAWPGDSTIHSNLDNSGRQLAVAFPIAPVITPKMPRLNVPSTVKISSKKSAVVIKLPPSVDEAIDVCTVTAQRWSKIGAVKAQEVFKWGVVFLRQMNSSPTITPLGGPYSLNDRTGLKLWYMPDGRLKTIVQR